MKKRLQERSTSPYYNPRTLNQKKYVESINNNQITIGIGPAGTGKTLFACAYAVNQLQQNKISKKLWSTIHFEKRTYGKKTRGAVIPWDYQYHEKTYLQKVYFRKSMSGNIFLAI